MFKKKGLIIHGPLISKGRTGKISQVPFSKVIKSDIVEYNCVSNIIKLFKEYQSLFDTIICLTWDDQDPKLVDELKNAIPKGSLFLIKDTSKKFNPKGELIPGNNKYRQFLSIYEGSKILSYLNCDLVTKIRSDQFLDLNLLLNDAMCKLNEDEGSFILVPWMNVESSFSIFEIPDHYFSARTQDMLDFSSEYLNYPEIFDNVHTDIFFKWSMRSLSRSLLIKKYIQITSKFGNNLFLRLLINKKVAKRFYKPLNKSILHSLYWRGEKFSIDDTILADNEINYSKFKSTTFKNILIKVIKKLTS